jgi:uncharacterized protein
MTMQLPQSFAAGAPETITLGPSAIPALRIAPVAPAAGPLPCLLLQHGYGADKYDLEAVGEVTAGLGFVTILPDAWGHGERFDPKQPNYNNAFSANYFVDVVRHVIDDLAVIVGALRQDTTIDAARIFLGGFSLGGITAIMATERDPTVAGVIAIAGGVSPASLEASLGMAPVDDGHRTWVAEHDMGAPQNAAKLAPRPVLLMHGRRDDRLPVSGTVRLYEAAQPAYADFPERLQMKLYDATHEISMPMLGDAIPWLVAASSSESGK